MLLAGFGCATKSGGGVERQLTSGRYGHVLTNTGVWSPDGRWIVYDVRSDAAGAVFDGERIERVNVESGAVEVVYRATEGAKCGVATYGPGGEVVFILGPERPTAEWDYGPNRRQGVIVRDGAASNLDARDLVPPFTPGALRGGTHVHVFSADGKLVSFTYNDYVVAAEERNVGVCILGRPMRVTRGHARNLDGESFSVLMTRTTAWPRPGGDEIRRAVEEAWVGRAGYVRADGSRQGRAIAFQGEVTGANGQAMWEVFIVDLPEDLTVAGDGPLEGTSERLPAPPRGVVQRRLTFTAARKYPGLAEPRHWVRSSPDGSRIAFLMKDDDGVVQIWTVSPNGGEARQVTRNAAPVASAFSWSADGRWIAHVLDGSVAVTDVETGVTRRLTQRVEGDGAPRPEACVFSPDGSKVAYVRRVDGFNQVFVVDAKER
jgi:dipeptidyl aminopeptidase/acylaminoacyl peptidase